MKIISFTERTHGEVLYLVDISQSKAAYSVAKKRDSARKMNSLLAKKISKSIFYDKKRYELNIEDA